MKKYLFVLCLALLLTLICTSAMAVTIGNQYKYHGNIIDNLATVNGKEVLPAGSQDNKVLVEPTCKTGKAAVGLVDGNFEYIDIDPIHNLELRTLDGKPASCEQNGVGKYFCKDCGAEDPYNQGEVAITATGHKFDKKVVDIKETHFADGKYHMQCSVCGKDETNLDGTIKYVVEPKHAFVASGTYQIDVVQTCKVKGIRYELCEKCGLPETNPPTKDAAYNVLAPHSFGEWVILKAASCVDGVKSRYCSVCNYEETQVIPGTGIHDFTYTVSAPACVKDANIGVPAPAAAPATLTVKARCTACGLEKTLDYTDPADKAIIDAKFGNYKDHHKFVKDPSGADTPAGCVDSGIYGTKKLICSICGGYLIENIPPATSHKYGEWKLVVKPGTDGTQNGVWERYCTNYMCTAKETYVGTKAPSGAPTVAPSTAPTSAPSGVEKYTVTSWGYNSGSGVSGKVAGNVSYRTPGLSVNIIIYTPTGTFLAVSAPVDENGNFSAGAGGAVYAVSIQLKDNTKTYQTDGKYV